MRTADCSSVHWLPMKQMTHEHRRRSILMFSTGSSVCCRLAGEVPVQPAMNAWQSGEEPNYWLLVLSEASHQIRLQSSDHI